MNFIEIFMNRILGRPTFKVTENVSYSKPVSADVSRKLNQIIKDNVGNAFEVGEHVCYLVDKRDIEGAANDPQRPAFDNAIIMEFEQKRFFRPALIRIEQDKKSIWVMPQLLKKL